MSINPTTTATSIVAEVCNDGSVTAALVSSKIDFESYYANKINSAKEHARTRLRKERDERDGELDNLIENARLLGESNNLLEARKLVAANVIDSPQTTWWCETREHLQTVIEGIYERLAKSSRPYDAYDFGHCGSFLWISFWRD